MSKLARYAWVSAEVRCFQYINKELGTIENVTGYRGELPRTANKLSGLNMWVFEISGGSDSIQVPIAQRPSGCWRMDAMWRGIFTERDLAMETAGRLREILPAGNGDIEDVERLMPKGEPTIDRQVIQAANDQDQGGEIRVWVVEYPLEIAFHNAEKIT